MAKKNATGFVSYYRTADKLEATYLAHSDPAALQGQIKDGQKTLYEFAATKKIEKAVATYKKSPSKAMVPVTALAAVEGKVSVAGAAGAAPGPGRPAKAGAKKRGRPAKKAAPAAKKAGRPAKKRGRPPKAKAAAPAAPKKRGRPPKKATAAPAAAPKKPGRPPKAAAAKAPAAKKVKGRPGRRSRVSDQALREMAALVKEGKTKKDVEAMLKQKYNLAPASPTYYVWKRRAMALA